MQEYKIKFFNQSELDSIRKMDDRYSNVDENNLGFADPISRTAYVLDTKIPELNRELINHEFSHLLESEGTHEDEYGIRHKKFFKEVITPIWTGYNPSKDSWSPLGISNTGGKEPEIPYSSQDPNTLPGYSFSNSQLPSNPDVGTTGAMSQFTTPSASSSQLPSSLANSLGDLSPDIIQQLLQRKSGFAGTPYAYSSGQPLYF